MAHERITLVCSTCAGPFSVISHRKKTAKYCSSACYWRAMKGRGSVEHKCLHCDKIFFDSPSKMRKYCSISCTAKSNKEIWRPGFSTVRKHMLAREMISECARCSYKEEPRILGVHHKDRNRKNNDLDNLEVLCPICHSLEHLKHIAHGFQE